MTALVAFDLDGTLVDSRLDLAGSANRLLAEYGAGPLAVATVVDMVGEGARMLVRRVLAAARVEADLEACLERFLAIYDEHLLDHTRLYPGVVDALDALEGRAALAVLTNKPAHHTRRLLDALAIGGRFLAVIGGDDRWPRKPDPAALSYLIERAGAVAADTIMVGDSTVDVETAAAAGARVCVAAYGFGHRPGALPAGALVVDDSRALAGVLLAAVGGPAH